MFKGQPRKKEYLFIEDDVVSSRKVQKEQDSGPFSTVACQGHRRDVARYGAERQFWVVVWCVSVPHAFFSTLPLCI